MSILDSLSRNIKNVFVGSHKGEDVSPQWSHPHDSMPIANGTNRYASPEKLAELAALEKNPRPEEDMADWFKIEQPDESDQIEEEKKLYMKKCMILLHQSIILFQLVDQSLYKTYK